MIYLFYGKDSFRIKRKAEEWIREWEKKNGKEGFSKLEGKNIDFSELRSEFFSYSMFSSKKFIIVVNASENAKLKESIIEEGESFASSENTLLFIEYDFKPSKGDSFVSFATKSGTVERFDILEEKEALPWIIKEAKNIGVEIKNTVASELFKNTKGDLWQIENELKKLSNYVLFEKRKEITLADIDKLIDKFEDGNIFAITDAIGTRNKKSALILIDNYLKNGGVALVLFATIATHIKNLLAVKAAPTLSAGELGMAPFVKMKCSSQSAKYSLEELKDLFGLLVVLDRKIKIGQIGQIEAVETFIIAL
ncbi:MAG: DNA polymerase III subunit delta [Candidatus Paceibacterota bacterium]